MPYRATLRVRHRIAGPATNRGVTFGPRWPCLRGPGGMAPCTGGSLLAGAPPFDSRKTAPRRRDAMSARVQRCWLTGCAIVGCYLASIRRSRREGPDGARLRAVGGAKAGDTMGIADHRTADALGGRRL